MHTFTPTCGVFLKKHCQLTSGVKIYVFSYFWSVFFIFMIYSAASRKALGRSLVFCRKSRKALCYDVFFNPRSIHCFLQQNYRITKELNKKDS